MTSAVASVYEFKLNQWMWDWATGKRSSKAPKAAAAGSSEVERIAYDEKIKHEIYLCQIIVHVISCDD